MALDLTLPADLLKCILTLDLDQCGIAVCIASGDPDEKEYEYRLVNQSEKLAQKFRDAIAEALETYRQNLEDDNIELRDFSAETIKPEQEIEYLNILPYDSIKKQIEPVANYLDLSRFRHDKHDFIKKMRFYVVRVEPQGMPPINFYRRYSPSQMLSQSPFFGMWLQKDYYQDLDEPTFLFDRHIDCFSCEEHMFILQKHYFFQIFNISELEKVARETLDKLEKKDFIHNFQQFKKDVLTRLAAEQDKQRQENLIQPIVNALLTNDEIKMQTLLLTSEVSKLYKAILPDTAEREFTLPVYLYRLIKDGIYNAMRPTGFREALGRVTRLVRESLDVQSTEERLAADTLTPRGSFDLRDIDLNALNGNLRRGHRHIKAEQLRHLLYERIRRMIEVNPSRITYMEKLERAIARYNANCANFATDPQLVNPQDKITPLTASAQEQLQDEYDDALVALTGEITEEEQRSQQEGLSEEELAIFDLLTLNISLSEEKHDQVREIARSILAKLRPTFSVIDWHKKPLTRGRASSTIEDELLKLPQTPYDQDLCEQKQQALFLYIREHYKNDGTTSVASRSFG